MESVERRSVKPNVLNVDSLAGCLGLLSAHLPQSHSLLYAHAWSAVAVLLVDAIFQFLKTNISQGSVTTPFRCGGL